MLLTATARRRVVQEADAIRAWLADPPVPTGVDARSLDVQRRKHERHTEDLQDRLEYLDRVLQQSVADERHPGGYWVTPGCMVGLRFGDENDVELAVISSMDLGNVETTVSPFTELGRALEGVDLGTTVRYEAALGPQTVAVLEVID
jgi:transcription elongation GreA/GreB family factor